MLGGMYSKYDAESMTVDEVEEMRQRPTPTSSSQTSAVGMLPKGGGARSVYGGRGNGSKASVAKTVDSTGSDSDDNSQS